MTARGFAPRLNTLKLFTVIFKKVLKTALTCILTIILFTSAVFAEINTVEIPKNGDALDFESPEDITSDIDDTFSDEKDQPKCPPDICGEIIFDLTEQAVPITLQESLAIVLNKNFDIEIFLQRKLRDRWLTYQAASEWLPDIQGQFEIQRLQGKFLVSGILPDVLTEVPIRTRLLYEYNINARKWFALKEAYYNYKSTSQDLEFTRDEVLLEAARRYYKLLQAKTNIKILKTNVQQIEEQFRINKQRVAAGAGTKFDVLRAEADRDNAIQQLLRAQNLYRLAQAQLSNVLGLPVFIQLEPNEDDIFVKEIFCNCLTIQNACNAAMSCRNDLCAQKYDIKAARQRVNTAYSIYLPEFSIFGQVAEAGTTGAGFSGNSSIGLLIEWFGLENLGLRGYTEAKSLKAVLNEEKLQYVVRTRNIQENLVRAFSDIIIQRQLIDSTFKELIAASQSREISLIRLKEGIGSFIDVIQTQSVFTEARLDNINSITNYNIAQIELLFEMGVISPQNIINGFDIGAFKSNTNIDKAADFNKKIIQELEGIEKDAETAKPQKQTQTR